MVTQTTGPTILHVARADAWAEAQSSGVYAPPELARLGFLHACTREQLAFVLARHFATQTGLVLLEFDPAHTGARLEWVRSEPDQDPFPHLHGPIIVAEVVSVTPL